MTLSEHENERLRELYEYEILDTMQEKEFDGLTRLASRICNTSISLINLLDKSRQWTKSSYGFNISEMPREESVCQYTIQQNQILEIERLDQDPRFNNFPYVKEDPYLKYYAGAPLITPNGYHLGAICVMDSETGKLDDEQLEDLKIIADEVMARLELHRQKRTLYELNKQKDELIRIASHDIRNPLMGIIGASDFMLEDQELSDEEKEEMLRMIKDSGEQLLPIVNDFLNSELISFDSFTTRRDTINPLEVTQKAVNSHQYAAKIKEITLEVDCKTDHSEVQLDKQCYTRIIGNLVSNAIKFTPEEGKVTVILDYHDRNSTGDLVVKVKDTGIGIPDDELEDLFETEGKGREGTAGEPSHGLGLHIVKQLTRVCNGTIDVESEVGVGTTFTVKLPAPWTSD